MTLRRAQNMFMPRNINFVTIVITWRALRKITTEQNDNKTVQTPMWGFWWAKICFAKIYISAHKMGHIAQQSNHNFLYFLSEKWPSALQSPLINGVEIGRERGGEGDDLSRDISHPTWRWSFKNSLNWYPRM